MSENTLNQALGRLDFKGEMVSHGFRGAARTLLVEKLGLDAEVVEAQLAHAKSGPLGSAYDRAEYMAQRTAMMDMWGHVVSDCAKGKPFPKAVPARKAPAKQATPAPVLDAAAMAKVLGKLAGKRVTAAQVKAALGLA